MRKRTLPHNMTLDRSFHKLEQIALNYKRSKDYQAWLDGSPQGIYWKIYP